MGDVKTNEGDAEALGSTSGNRVFGRRFFLWFAFLVITGFVAWQVWQAVLDRKPDSESLLFRVRGEKIERAFEPGQHDRKLELPDGSYTSLSHLAGKTLFLNFWSTTCKPCVEELPSMIKLAELLQNEAFVMVAVSNDPSWKPIMAFFQRHFGGMPPNLVIMRDPGGEKDPLMHQYGTRQLPETYLIQNGSIRHKFVNKHDWTHPHKLTYFELLLDEGRGSNGSRK